VRVRPGQAGRTIVEHARATAASAIIMPIIGNGNGNSLDKTHQLVLAERPCRVIVQTEPSHDRVASDDRLARV